MVADAGRVPPRDPLLTAARWFFYCGLVCVSLLVFRVAASVTAGDALLLASTLLLLLNARRPKGAGIAGRYTLLASMLILVGGLLAWLEATSGAENGLALMRVMLVAVVLPWQSTVLLRSGVHIRRALMAFSLGAGASAAGTVIQFLRGASAIPGGSVSNAGRYTGFTGNVSDMGGIAAVAVVLGLGFLDPSFSKWQRCGLASTFASGLIGLVLSGSVSGMLAAGLGVAIVLVVRGVKLRHVVSGLAISVAGLALASNISSLTGNALTPMERVQQVLGLRGGPSDLNTSASRWDTVVAGWHDFLSVPFTGVGLDSNGYVVLGDLGVHDIWVASLRQGGLFFTAGLAIVVFSVLFTAWRYRGHFTLSISLAAGITALVFAMTAPSFYNRYFWLPLALLLAALEYERVDELSRAQMAPAHGVPDPSLASMRSRRAQ